MCVIGGHGVAQRPAHHRRHGQGRRGLAKKLGTECFHWQGTSRVAGVDLVGVLRDSTHAIQASKAQIQ